MTSIFLVRHAKALDRQAWTEPDELRPLSPAGRRQAAALPEHFGRVAFERLVSSPHVRCVQTLEPLAEGLGTSVEPADELAEGSSARGALELALTLSESGHLALCTHGDVLLDALFELRADRVPLDGPLECKKGSTWVLDVVSGAVRGGRYLRPPATGKTST